MVVSIVAYISASPSDTKKKESPTPPTLEELGVRASAEEAELVNTGWGGFWSTPQQAPGTGGGSGGASGVPVKRVGAEEEEG